MCIRQPATSPSFASGLRSTGVSTSFPKSFTRQARQWAGVRRIARTCLQDAVDITFGDLFGAYAASVASSAARVRASVDRLHSVHLGGTVVGRIGDVPSAYFASIVEALNRAAGGAG